MIEIPSWAILNFFTFFLLILLLIFQNNTSRLQTGRKYSAILICTLILLFSETIGRIGENNADKLVYLAYFGYYVIFLLDPVDILFALSYIDCWMDRESSVPRRIFKGAFEIFAAVNGVLVTVSSMFNLRWFFYFENGLYYRGEFFLVRALVLMVFILLVLVYAVVFRKDLMSDYKNAILILPLFAVFGALVQVFVSTIETTYAGISLGCLVIFFFFQSKDKNIDYLTGVLNRRGLDIKMEDMIKISQTSGRNFTAIMMDLDNFKSINDTFGHEEGDKAIKIVADILVDYFGKSATIGRFGGDEFCIITDKVSTAEIEILIEKCRNKLGYIRDKRGWDKGVDISCGYKVYEYGSGLKREEFSANIDELMYIQKQQHHMAMS